MAHNQVSVSAPQRHWRTGIRTLATFIAALLIVMLGAIAPSTAFAAPNQVQVDRVEFVNQNGSVSNEFTDGSLQILQVDMSIPGNATVPVAGTIHLDQRLNANDDIIVIKSPEGEDIGLCNVYSDRVECELEDWYVLENPLDMKGSFEFWVWIAAGNSETEDTEFEVGNSTTNTVTLSPRPGQEPCETDCEWTGTDGFKGGTYKPHEGTIEWWIRVPAGPDGLPVGVPVLVEEHLDDSMFEIIEATPRVYYFNRVIRNDQGQEQLVYPSELPADEYVVSNNGKNVSFITAPGLGADADLPPTERGLTGRVYDVVWKVKVLDGGAAGTYRNDVTITVGGPDGDEVYEKDGTVGEQGGNANAVGRNQGRISLEKLVTGTAADRDDLPTAYTVTYTACDTTNNYDPVNHTGPGCADGTAQLRPGSPTWLPDFNVGTRVIGTEVTPTEPEGVSWDGKFQLVDEQGNPIPGASEDAVFDVTFSTENNNLAKTTYYQVTNVADATGPNYATFQANKFIQNDDGIDLSGVTSYTLDYTYPAGSNFPAGQGTLTLPASGATVESGEVPIGAVLTFTEVPPAVPNASWQPAVIQPNPLTITGADDQAQIVVTNQIDANVGHFTAVKEIQTDDGIDPRDLPDIQLNYWYEAAGQRVDGNLTLTPGGPTVISENIPVGSVVTFEEVTPGTVPGITWGTPVISPQQLTITEDIEADVLVTVTNPVELDNGHFVARKSVTGLEGTGIDPATLPSFNLDYTWELAGTTGTGTLLVRDGESEISDVVPIGATVTISETRLIDAPEGYEWGTPVILPNDTFVMQDGVDVEIVVENPLVATHGRFVAAKSIDDVNDTGADFGGLPPFTVEYTWSLDGATGSGSIAVSNGESGTSGLIPFGAEVVVTEATPSFTQPGFAWGTPVIEPSTFTLVEGSEVTVSVTNPATVEYGSFSARKAIENPGNIDVSGNTEFVLLYEWSAVGSLPGGSDFLRLNSAGDLATSLDIPYGATVTVYEIPPTDPVGGEWNDPSIEWNGTPVSEFVMAPGDQQLVELLVTNTVEREQVRFFANKVVENDGGVDLSGITGYDLEYSYVFPWVAADAPAAERGGTATLNLPATGQTMQSISLPHGTEVTVTEVAPVGIPGATWSEPVLSVREFTLDAESERTVSVTATNTISRDLAPFSANKVIVNDEGLDLTDIDGYELQYSYTYPWVPEDASPETRGGSGTLLLPASGETVWSEQLPHGTQVVVDEVNVTSVSGAIWAEPELSVREFTIDAIVGESERVNVVVTNQLVRDTAHFQAQKNVINPDEVDLTGVTEYTLDYTYEFPWIAEDALEEERGGSGVLTLAADGTLSAPSAELPHGTLVTVSEVAPAEVSGAKWGDPEYSTESFVIDADSDTVFLVSVTNHITDTEPKRTPPPGNEHGLPTTGSDDASLIIGAVAVALILAAGVTLAVRSRRVVQ